MEYLLKLAILKSEWNRAKRLCIGGAFFVGVGSNKKCTNLNKEATKCQLA
ncbi:hypothetical protein A407_0309 [Listeria monocytogenes serotype 4b str. 81-0861]|nr:hypothetical protein A407_0309 [Listeria monocytogenes serotype 4b str. 81-0861]ASH31293.1 hypothetical protein A408_0311 [Listeria monocytogenes serotype 4b str. 10-0809]